MVIKRIPKEELVNVSKPIYKYYDAVPWLFLGWRNKLMNCISQMSNSQRAELKKWAEVHEPHGLVQAKLVLALLSENDELKALISNSKPQTIAASEVECQPEPSSRPGH